MHRRTIGVRAALATVLAVGLAVGAAQPAFAWSSAYTPNQPGDCWESASLVGQSWYPSSWESRSTSASEGPCPTYVLMTGHYPPLSAGLRYTSGGHSALATTTSSRYVTTTGWAHVSSYLGGYHTWGGVVLHS